MVAHFALLGGVLSVVIVLLGGALAGATDESSPHGEINGGNANTGHKADHAAHPLEGEMLVQGCIEAGGNCQTLYCSDKL